MAILNLSDSQISTLTDIFLNIPESYDNRLLSVNSSNMFADLSESDKSELCHGSTRFDLGLIDDTDNMFDVYFNSDDID